MPQPPDRVAQWGDEVRDEGSGHVGHAISEQTRYDHVRGVWVLWEGHARPTWHARVLITVVSG